MGNGHLPWPAVNALSNVAQDTIWCFYHKVALLAHVQLHVHQDPHRSFSDKLLFPNIYFCIELFFPRCRPWHFFLVNFTSFLSAHSFNLLRSLWLAVQPSALSATPPIRCHLQTYWRNLKTLRYSGWFVNFIH